jgi:hypothetical protein
MESPIICGDWQDINTRGLGRWLDGIGALQANQIHTSATRPRFATASYESRNALPSPI